MNKSPVPRTWKPTIAGILIIVGGAFNVTYGIAAAFFGGPKELPIVSTVIGVPIIILGIVSIVGGSLALKRRVWGLALAGAICCAVFPPPGVLGILSIIFVSIGKREFD